METKKILTKKHQQSSHSNLEKTQKNNNKKNEQNPYLSESGGTTTSSVSSNTKNNKNDDNKNNIKGNYKTPKKTNFQNFKIPLKKNGKTISPDFINKKNKISKVYSKGIITKIKQENTKNNNEDNKNNINNNINNNIMNNTINNNNMKQYNRSMSSVSMDNNANNNNINVNTEYGMNVINRNKIMNINNLYNKIQANKKKKNVFIIKKKNNQNFENSKDSLFPSPINTINTTTLNNINNYINNNLYTESDNDMIKTEKRKINKNIFNNININVNNLNLTIKKNLEDSYYYLDPNKLIKSQISASNLNLIPSNLSKYYDNSPSNGYYSEAETKKEKSGILNLEELLMTEEKLMAVINCINDKKPCAEECFEWMNSYVQSDLIFGIEKLFVKEQFIKIVKIAVNLNIFSLILCYVISFEEIFFKKINSYLYELMDYNHKNLILICKYFLNKIIERNMWVEKLTLLINNYDSNNKNTLQIMKEINYYCNTIIKKIPYILSIINFYQNPELILLYHELEIISSHDLIKIYREKFHKNLNQNGSIFASSAYFLTNKIYDNNNIKMPFLSKKNIKPYTLVLDLDETLIHFKSNPNNESSGKIMIRPYLYDFLKNIRKYYELIIFTAATQDYADPIIDAIEKEEKFFDHRLYRIHTTIIDNDFVKDLSKLGRDLNKTIIVDNMKQNYKNQPNNGITIRPFWGKDVEDTALVDLLDILVKIAEKKMNVITGLKFYKEDIISKVSSNILRRAQNK